ncbi:hypothetical protein E2C01_101979 [Portunus trituberculatus]|uniref:Uncharacterized protein n=1 Tax=Portunus trituberculatus TaxID=210409 RepID=A0A5B7KH94_PORTR|nr:hypothetical protein [Portunus trituberculatus]
MSGGRYIFEARIQATTNFSLDITRSFLSSFGCYGETRRAITRKRTAAKVERRRRRRRQGEGGEDGRRAASFTSTPTIFHLISLTAEDNACISSHLAARGGGGMEE